MSTFPPHVWAAAAVAFDVERAGVRGCVIGRRPAWLVVVSPRLSAICRHALRAAGFRLERADDGRERWVWAPN
jgi:hypothetical protein